MASDLLARFIVGILAWFIAPGQSQPLPTRPPGTTPTPAASPTASPTPTTLAPQDPAPEASTTVTPEPTEIPPTSLDAQASRDLVQAEIREIRLVLLELVERLAFLEAQLATNTLPTPEPERELAEPESPDPAQSPAEAETTAPSATLPTATLILGTQTISLPGDVLFDFNSTELRPEARALLRRVVNSVQESMPEGHIHVAGHTDNIGSAAYNLGLSLERANVVKDYLRSILQAEATRYSWTAVGYGMSQPVASNDTEAGRQSNRRVDLIVRPASEDLN